MSDQPTTTETTATDAPASTTDEQPKPTETVDFWKQKAREQEKRAKENADAAKRLTEIEDSQKSEAEKTADRIAKADAAVATIPNQVADGLREHLIALHEIEADDAELFLTGTDPELLLKQVSRLLAQKNEQSDTQKKKGNKVPSEGGRPTPTTDQKRAFLRDLTSQD